MGDHTICRSEKSNHTLPFTFAGQSMHAFERDGEVFFVANEVATALGYSNSRKAVQDHCKSAEICKSHETLLLGLPCESPRGLTIIPESDLYRLIFRSKLPSAVAFERKVVHEVLPTIRKTGGYMVAAPNETPEELAHRALTVLNDTLRRKNAEIATLEPKALAFDSLINNGELPSLRTFFKQFHELNLIAIPATLGELGYLRRSDRYVGQWEVRRSHPRAAALFRQRINQGLKWNYVTVLLTPQGQEEMAWLYRQGAFPKLVRFSH